MPRFDANITLLYTEVPFLDRFDRARQSGFDAVECWFPYDCSVDVLHHAMQDAGMEMVLINAPAGDWAGGERGILALPGREREFRDGFSVAVGYAKRLGCTRINCLAGVPGAGVSKDDAEATLIDNLKNAAPLAAKAGITLLIEPVNNRDTPGCYLSSVTQARHLLGQVGADNLAIQYDMYHMQRMQGELIGTFRAFQPDIGHIQIADNPGRHQPGTGEIFYPNILRALDQAGYHGYVGLEYYPDGSTEASLGWLHQIQT